MDYPREIVAQQAAAGLSRRQTAKLLGVNHGPFTRWCKLNAPEIKWKEHRVESPAMRFRLSVRRWFTYNGFTTSLRVHCEMHGMKYNTVYNRIKKGCSVKQALTAPTHGPDTTPRPKPKGMSKADIGRKVAWLNSRKKWKTAFGCTGSLKLLVELYGAVSLRIVWGRVNAGWDVEEALVTLNARDRSPENRRAQRNPPKFKSWREQIDTSVRAHKERRGIPA